MRIQAIQQQDLYLSSHHNQVDDLRNNLIIEVSVISTIIVLLMGDSKNKEKSMDILVPLVIIAVVVLFSIKKFKPQVWKKVTAKFRK
jgi:uncharacterized membrane protein